MAINILTLPNVRQTIQQLINEKGCTKGLENQPAFIRCGVGFDSESTTISHVEGLRLQFLGIDITNAYSESILYQLQMTEVNNNGLINSFNDATRAIQLINKNNSNISWQLEFIYLVTGSKTDE